MRVQLPALSLLLLQLTLARGPLPSPDGSGPVEPARTAPQATPSVPPKKTDAPKEGDTPSDRRQKETGVAGSASPAVRAQLAALLAQPDPAEVASWTKLLREPDPAFRRQVVIGLVRSLPDHAFEALAGQLDSEHPSQREAARYGIGMTGDPRVADALLSRARPGTPLDSALVGGLRMAYRPYVVAANQRALGIAGPDASSLRPVYTKIRDHIGVLWTTPGAHQTENLWRLGHRLADGAVAHGMVEAFLRTEPFETTRDRELFRRFCEVNRHWLGRPPAPETELTYDFHMENHATNPTKTKEFRLELDPGLGEALRCLHRVQVFGRGNRLELPLDDLLIDPARLSPTLRWDTDDQPTLEYRVRPGGGLVAAIGSLNTSYWLTRVANADRSVVRLAPDTAVPLSETIYSGDIAVANVRYEEFQTAIDRHRVPGRITVTSLQPTNFRDRQFETTLDFAWLPEQVWLFVDGNVVELDQGPDGDRVETLRASGRIEVVRAPRPTTQPGDNGTPPKGAPPKPGRGEGGGQ